MARCRTEIGASPPPSDSANTSVGLKPRPSRSSWAADAAKAGRTPPAAPDRCSPSGPPFIRFHLADDRAGLGFDDAQIGHRAFKFDVAHDRSGLLSSVVQRAFLGREPVQGSFRPADSVDVELENIFQSEPRWLAGNPHSTPI